MSLDTAKALRHLPPEEKKVSKLAAGALITALGLPALFAASEYVKELFAEEPAVTTVKAQEE